MTSPQPSLLIEHGPLPTPHVHGGGTVDDLGLRSATGLGTVAWARGHACREVAALLASERPIAAGPHLVRSCVEHRVDVLVTARLSGFDLVRTVVPQGVDLRRVRSITGAVADGPHSPLVAAVTARLAESLGLPGEMATVYRRPDELPAAMQRIERLGARYPMLGRRVAQASTAAGLTDTLSSFTLLVVGAPGGSWFQRQLYGPGHRLADTAPGGVVVVRDAPRRCFHAATDAAGRAVGPELTAADARHLITAASVPVADAGTLVGVLRARSLDGAADDALVAHLMEPPVAVRATEPLDAVDELRAFLDDGPVPVVDDQARLVGLVCPK